RSRALLVSFQHGTRTAARKARARLVPQVTPGVSRTKGGLVMTVRLQQKLILGSTATLVVASVLFFDTSCMRAHSKNDGDALPKRTATEIVTQPMVIGLFPPLDPKSVEDDVGWSNASSHLSFALTDAEARLAGHGVKLKT